MKKQLILLIVGVCIAVPLFAGFIHQRKHHGGKRKDVTGTLRSDYRRTFELINQNASKLKASEKERLIKKLTAHFEGGVGIEEVLTPKEAQQIYESAINTFTGLKKLEASRKRKGHKTLLGTEGRRHHYSPSLHFAQKVLGSIILPNPFLNIQKAGQSRVKMGGGPIISGPRTTPVGPEKGPRVKMGPANPIITTPAKTISPRK